MTAAVVCDVVVVAITVFMIVAVVAVVAAADPCPITLPQCHLAYPNAQSVLAHLFVCSKTCLTSA